MLESYLGSKDLCERIGIGRVTLHRWIYNETVGFPKPSRVGGKLFWKESDVAEYFESARAVH